MSATLAPPRAADRRIEWLSTFETFAAGRPPAEPGAVRALRRQAVDRFSELGFPTLRQEAWRSTDVSAVARTAFALAEGPGPVAESDLAGRRLAGAIEIVLVDGHFVPGLSRLEGLPDGVVLSGLAAALDRTPERVEAHLARLAAFADHPFTALNTAFFADGAFLELARGTVVERPIHLLHWSTGGAAEAPGAAFPRLLVVAGEASQVKVVETYAGAAGAVYLAGAVTEIVAGPAAVVDHYKVQHESREAFHFAAFAARIERAGNVFSHSVSAGGALTRADVHAALVGEGGECTLNGLYLAEGRQVVDNHMRVDHVAPHCNSYELYKGILDGQARTVFNGLIHVHPGAQKTDAKQSNRNLLLSQGAIANSNPQLEIFADDVRCTHGSTVGQLDADAVFYLRSRGIGLRAATSLLTYAFASDIVGRIKVDGVRHDLEEFLFARLPRGEVVRQAV